MGRLALRGQFLTYRGNPLLSINNVYHERDGLILIENGKILHAGQFNQLKQHLLPSDQLKSYDSSFIILPGFIDTHVHYPQIEMVGAYGKHLVDWLKTYVFPVEEKFADEGYARKIAQIYLRESLRAGTTSACVYATVFPSSVEAFFAESNRINTRMISGKVLMDRNAPVNLLDTPQSAYDDSKRLIEKWHAHGRQLYCITPRFAPTSTEEQLNLAGVLWSESPGVYVQTHLSETQQEIAWVKQLFPFAKNYLDVYDHYGLVGPRAIFGHGVHLTEDEKQYCRKTGACLAHCPTSNLFLGSGLFDIRSTFDHHLPMKTTIGTDLGAGTSFSQLQSLNEAYKISMLHDCVDLTALQAFHLITRGAAESLYLENKIGSIAEGLEADLTILDLHSTPYIKFRMQYVNSLEEALFLQMICGDDRAVHETFVNGESLYSRERHEHEGVFHHCAAHLNKLADAISLF